MRLREIIGETGTTKPKGPMDAEAWHRESERRRRFGQRVRDAQAACVKKVNDLKSRM